MVDSITLFGGECVLASASHGPSVVLFPLSRSYPTSSGSNSATSFLWEKAIMFSSRKEPFTAYPQTGANINGDFLRPGLCCLRWEGCSPVYLGGLRLFSSEASESKQRLPWWRDCSLAKTTRLNRLMWEKLFFFLPWLSPHSNRITILTSVCWKKSYFFFGPLSL